MDSRWRVKIVSAAALASWVKGESVIRRSGSATHASASLFFPPLSTSLTLRDTYHQIKRQESDNFDLKVKLSGLTEELAAIQQSKASSSVEQLRDMLFDKEAEIAAKNNDLETQRSRILNLQVVWSECQSSVIMTFHYSLKHAGTHATSRSSSKCAASSTETLKSYVWTRSATSTN